MAVSNISKFNWEKILTKVDSADAQRVLNVFRGKANEVAAAHAKFGKAPDAINFAAYKNKLKFTASAVDSLEKAYNSRKLPVFSAQVPDLEAKRREKLLASTQSIVDAANAQMDALNHQLEQFETLRVTRNTTVGQVEQRYPEIAREVEKEIKNHEW